MADRPVIAVRDMFQAVDAGPGCTAGIEGATCPYEGSHAVDVALGAGNDGLVANVGLPLNVVAGEGDDVLTMRSGGSPSPDAAATLDGGAGDDRLAAGPGDDVVLGGSGDDGIDGGAGNDRIDPGPGQDAVSDPAGDDTFEARDGD